MAGPCARNMHHFRGMSLLAKHQIRLALFILTVNLHRHVTFATDVVRFGHNDNSDNDDILNIIELEHLFLEKSSLPSDLQPKVPTRFNSSSIETDRTISNLTESNPVEISARTVAANYGKPSTLGSAMIQQSSTTFGLTPINHDGRLEDLDDDQYDFLNYDEDRDRMEKMEEQRSLQEHELVERIKRMAVQQYGSGLNHELEGSIKINLTFQANYSDPKSKEYSEILADLVQLFAKASLSGITVNITNVSGTNVSTMINFTIHFSDEVDTSDRIIIARVLAEIVRNGLNLLNRPVAVIIDPEITDEKFVYVSYRCFLCKRYQECVLVLATGRYICLSKAQTEYFPYGPNQLDKNFTASGEIRQNILIIISKGIPIKSELVNKFFMTQNGCISFGKAFRSVSPRSLSLVNKDVYCPYWVMMDPNLSSDYYANRIFYQYYDELDSAVGRQVNASLILRQADIIIASSRPGISFKSKYVLIVSYLERYPLSKTLNDNEVVNYQIAIVSDGTVTYGIAIYVQNGMTLDQRLQRKVSIGYLQQDLFINHFRPDIEVGSSGLEGLFVVELGRLPVITPAQQCINWYFLNYASASIARLASLSIPRCPCSYFVALLNGNWIPDHSLPRCLLSLPFYGSFGKRCCYTAIQTYDLGYQTAGSFLSNHPLINPSRNFQEDTLPNQWCCQKSTYCEYYRAVRPVDACQPFFIIVIALGIGDPHIQQYDGGSFPFNAIGWFVLTRIDSPDMKFELQARTCQASSNNGSLVQASIYCGFVAKQNSSELLYVSLSKNATFMEIYVGDSLQELTLAFRDDEFFESTFQDVHLRRSGNTLQVLFKGVSMNITLIYELLAMTLSSDYFTDFSGLLGNKNGNRDDDFMFPNGTFLPRNSSERAILEWGKSWAVDNLTTLLKNSGVNVMEHFVDSFVPLFLEDFDNKTIAMAEMVCNSTENVDCIYDYLVTNSTELARGTKTIGDSSDLAEKIAAIPVPQLSLRNESRINATVNTTVLIPLNVSVEGNSTYCLNTLQQPTNFSLNSTTQMASWTPTSMDKAPIVFSCTDCKTATSPELQIPIVLCSGCSGNGACDFDNLQSQETVDPYFQKASCVCDSLNDSIPYYDGDDCERNYDACADDPCPVNTTCIDLSPEQQKALGSSTLGFNCTGQCLPGYTFSFIDLYCYDIDECNENTSSCSQECTNTEGSYYCSCYPGFRLNSTATNQCIDINECAEKTDNCNQLCINTNGAFTCTCYDGFSLNSTDKSSCVKNSDPCRNLKNNCSYACENVSGVPVCVCPSGFQLASNNRTCEDINECDLALKTCNQNCTNSVGSFSCSCYPGFHTDSQDKVTCLKCDDDTYGLDCSFNCSCHGQGNCDPVGGCQCIPGWQGTDCFQDVDECAASRSPCPQDQICYNTNGSFICICPHGYEMNGTLCEDVDECATFTNNCNQNQTCINTDGSFVCSCMSGYESTSNTTCTDIDECALGTSGCAQICENFPGMATCRCRDGYVLADNRKDCILEQDLCRMLNKSCSYGCQINTTTNDGQCFCKLGFEVAPNGTCQDVNECASNITNRCSEQCINTNGGYNCSCNETGKVLSSNERTCVDCDPFHWGFACAKNCNCSPSATERCDNVKGCQCKAGWTGTYCDQDVNECLSSPCPNNSMCNNTVGSFFCLCNPGFEWNAGSCSDINECVASSCQNCTNTVGSYLCSCYQGFEKGIDGNSCQDVDECATMKPCRQLCRNTVGGYACDCFVGYNINLITGECDVATQCNITNRCSQGCYVVNGIEICSCTKGYSLASDQFSCIDIDECTSSNLNNCLIFTEKCKNTNGSYYCECRSGYSNTTGTCTAPAAEKSYNISMKLEKPASWNFSDPTARAFIENALINYFNNSMGPNAFQDFFLINISSDGSIEGVIHVNNGTVDATGYLAKALKELAQSGLSVNNTSIQVNDLKVNSQPLTASMSGCEIYLHIQSCQPGETCSAVNDVPSCSRPVEENSSNYELIVGLGVGIPLFFITLLVIAVLIYLYIRRRRKLQQEMQAELSEDRVSSIFAGQIATKAILGSPRHYQMYTPDTLSAASVSSSEGHLLKRQRLGRHDFQDSPWYQRATPTAAPSQLAPVGDDGTTSNFSWEYMFRLLEPYRDFEIQRPEVSSQPRPPFTSSSLSGARPDSAA